MDLEKLKAVIADATPGEWRTGEFLPRETVHQGQVVIDTELGPKVILAGNENFRQEAKADAAFAATFNPSVASELIAEIEKLHAFVEEYLEAWDGGMAGDSYLYRMAKALAQKGEQK